MKNILILAYDFPPLNTIGAQRPYSWYLYMKGMGLNPTIISRHWNDEINTPEDLIKPSGKQIVEEENTDLGKIIKVPFIPNLRDKHILKHGYNEFAIFRKLLTMFYMFFEHLFLFFDAKSNIYYQAKKELKKNKYDYIITSGEPYILFKYAHKLSKKYNIPWIADYRDGWSTTVHTEHFSGFDNFFRRNIARKFEKKYISNASLLTSASPNYSKDLKNLFPNKNIEVIFNGYRGDVIEKFQDIQQSNKTFNISYVGSIYPYQPINVFLDGYIMFLEKNNDADIALNLYGTGLYASHMDVINKYKDLLNDKIVLHERLPIEPLYKELKRSNLFLLLAHESVNALAGKIFDYLGLNRKMIMVTPDGGILEELIDKCSAGIKCYNDEDVCKTLEKEYNDFKTNGSVIHETKDYSFYSRENQTKELVKYINEICAE